jgi:hypothetical protein
MEIQPTPTASVERRRYRVGKWTLEHSTRHPLSIWAIPEYLTNMGRASNGIYYGEDMTQKMGWDLPIPPKYVRQAALSIMRELAKEGNP